MPKRRKKKVSRRPPCDSIGCIYEAATTMPCPKCNRDMPRCVMCYHKFGKRTPCIICTGYGMPGKRQKRGPREDEADFGLYPKAKKEAEEK